MRHKRSGDVVAAIPRYRPQTGPVVLSAGFRPFFLLASFWASLAIPIWLAFFTGHGQVPTALSPVVWHVHEMIFGFGAATVAGFLLTAIPNWTGRMPLQGGPLAFLVLLWAVGRVAVLVSAKIGPDAAAALDLAFPVVFLGAVGREIFAGRNWRNLPMLGALALLLLGNLLVHLESVGVASTAELGNRLGVATLLMLISFVGGRIVPSFTRNWLTKQRPDVSPPSSFDLVDRAALAITALALATWVIAPEARVAPWVELAAGLAISLGSAPWLRLAFAWLLAPRVQRPRSNPATDHGAACAHGRRDRHNDTRCHDQGVARPHRAPIGRRTRHDHNLRAGDARRHPSSPVTARRRGIHIYAISCRGGVERRVRALHCALRAAAHAASGQS